MDDFLEAFFGFGFGSRIRHRIDRVFFIGGLGGNAIWRAWTGHELAEVRRPVSRASGEGQNLR